MTASRQSLAPSIEPPEITALQEIAPSDRAYLATRLLWQQKRLVVRWIMLGSVLFAIIALLIPNRYEAQTQLMPPDSQSGAMGMLAAMMGGAAGGGTGGGSGGAMSVAADLLGLKTSGALFISILTSETVENRIINRFDLRRLYGTKTYRGARQKLESLSDIHEQKKSGVISITVGDSDPKRAAAIAGAYVEELDRMVADLNTSAAHRERIFLEDRLKVVKKDLDASSKEFSEFSSKNTAIDLKEQGKAMVEAAASLQGEEIAAESQLRGLEQIYTGNNVRVRSVRARIAELAGQLRKLGGAATSDPDAPNGEPALYPSIRQLPVLGLTYTDLFRRVKINETVFEILTKEYELARVQEAKEVPSVKVIDPAEVPERKSWPPRTLIVLGGALLSFCAAAVWLFAREAWNSIDPQAPPRILLAEIGTEVADRLHLKRAREVSLKVVSGPLLRRFHRNGNHSE